MDRLLAVAFAFVMACQVGFLLLVGALVLMLPFYLWRSSPTRTVLLVLGFVLVLSILWRTHLRAPSAPQGEPSGPPQISMSRIPMSGSVGAIYMLQFVVWALLSPAVGLFFAALIGGALLLLPLIFRLSQPGGAGPWATAAGALLGALCGVAGVAAIGMVAEPLAKILLVALCAGGLAGPVLVWLRSRQSDHVSIAAYRNDL